MIRDLGSRNGVRVNGLLVDEAQLHGGDEIAIGPILFRVELETTPPPPPPPPVNKPSAKAALPKPPSLPSLPSDGSDDLIPLDF
jgi:hypothetical protein